MPSFFDDYSASSDKPFADVVAAVAASAAARGFRVLHVHDFQALLAEKGLRVEPTTLVEMCRPQFGGSMLSLDPQMSLIMPCRVAVYVKDGTTHISALRPRLIGDLLPDLAPLAEEEDALMRAIVDEAAR